MRTEMADVSQDGTLDCVRHLEVTVPITPVRRDWPPPHPENCTARDVLDRVGDKWTAHVVALLGTGTLRFSDIRRAVDGISPRMLTVTLRGLERDGLVDRRVYPVIPPRVEYTLTELGESLCDLVRALIDWSAAHTGDILAQRQRYDAVQSKGHGDDGHA
jgi:DNA-binding HxlR family transcriptional regulator